MMVKISKVALFFVLLVIVYACKKNNDEQWRDAGSSGNGFRIAASTETAPGFRTGHTDGEGKITVTWEKGDKIGLFTLVGIERKNANVPLEIEKDEDINNAGKNAVFSGELSQNLNWNLALYAYYPHSNEAGENPKSVSISVGNQIIDGKQSKHLAKYDVLVADPVKNYQLSQTNATLNFKHVMAIADFKITLPVANEAIEIREIKIMRAGGKRIQTSGTLDITAEDKTERLSITSTSSQSSYAQLTKVENVALAHGESFNAKIALFPTDWTGETISIYVKTSVGTYKIEKPGIRFEAGKRYNSELALDNLLPVNIGDYYYADGTWSTDLDATKKVVGIVVYKGRQGGSSNGYVAALKDTETIPRAKGDTADEAIDVPEIPNLPKALIANTPPNYYAQVWNVNAEYGSFIAVEDWNGKQYAEMIKRKRNQEGYNKLHFLLKSVDFELEGVTDGPAAKGNWFTPTWTQLHALTFNYEFLQQRFVSAGGSFANRERWSSSEPLLTNTSSTNYSRLTAYTFIYGALSDLGVVIWRFRFSHPLKGEFPIRPYLEF